jgi:hypothetical protein
MSTDDTAARISALEARVAELETVNARLVEVANRLFCLIENRTLWAVEEFVERDEKTAQTRDELETAIRSRAPRGFKFPITVVKQIFKKPADEETFHRWCAQLRHISGLAEVHQLVLQRNGMIAEWEDRFK